MMSGNSTICAQSQLYQQCREGGKERDSAVIVIEVVNRHNQKLVAGGCRAGGVIHW